MKRIGLLAAIVGALVLQAIGTVPVASAREQVAFDGSYRRGTVVVVTHERQLYFVTGRGAAIRYPVAVGKPGKQWQGRTRITRKVRDPVWAAPAAVSRDLPHLPKLIPPGPRNPLGIAALPLAHGEYAIHGTNRPGSIGKAVSYGCIRMHNRDIADLFERVRKGTAVVVLP